jgi:hypothetical protein
MCSSSSSKNSAQKNNFTARDTEVGRQAGGERVLQMMASQGKGLRKHN